MKKKKTLARNSQGKKFFFSVSPWNTQRRGHEGRLESPSLFNVFIALSVYNTQAAVTG